MIAYSGRTDDVHLITVQPRITRCFWSARRAFHGAKLHLHVETRNVPDGTPITIQIWEDDSAEGTPDDFVDQLPTQTGLSKGKLTVPYELDWSPEALAKELELEGDDYEFYFRVEIPKHTLTARSTLLYVDLEPFRFSR